MAATQIDPNTGERVGAAQIDPRTGERVQGNSEYTPPPEPGFFQGIQSDIAQTLSAPAQDTGWRGDVERVGQAAAQGLTAPFVHPLKTAEGMAASSTPIPLLVDSARGVLNGNLGETLNGNPLVQQARQQGEEIGAHPREGLERLGGNLLGGALLGRTISGMAAAPKAISEYRSPTPVTLSPQEITARSLTKLINPPVSDWNPYIKTLTSHTGDILDYANRQNIPLKTQLDFGKTAEGAGNEAYSHYRQNLLEPNANARVSLGAGQPEMTLDQMDKRIADINKLLRPSYQKGNVAETESSLAAKDKLQAEATQLQDKLVGELSQRTGVPTEQVAALRKRYGGLQDVSRETTEAVNRRQSGEGPTQTPIPRTFADAAMAPIDWLRGGSQAIADRALARTVKGVFANPTSLPQVNPPPIAAPVPRSPLWAGIQAERPPLLSAEPNPEDVGRVMSKIEGRRQSVFDQRSQQAQQAAADSEQKQMAAEEIKQRRLRKGLKLAP